MGLISVSGCSDDADSASEDRASDLVELLLSDADVAALLPQLHPQGSYSTGEDYGIIQDAEFAGPTATAGTGVVRQWSQPYSWSTEEAVNDVVIYLSSQVITFDTPADAQGAASEVIELALSEGATQYPAPSRFEAVAAAPAAGPEPRNNLATATMGNVVVVVQLAVAGDGSGSELFGAVLDAADAHLG